MDELHFTSGDGVSLEEAEGEELLPGGAQRRVTEANKHEYVALLVEHRAIGYCRAELDEFAKGVADVVPSPVLRSDTFVPGLSALDLELVAQGLPGIDLADWRTHTKWHCRQTELRDGEDVVYAALKEMFWAVLLDFDLEDRAKLLAFASGSGRLPAGGFGALRPPFNIEVLPAQSVEHLPNAHTCFNNLCMPPYESAAQLEARLRAAIQADAGFGFA